MRLVVDERVDIVGIVKTREVLQSGSDAEPFVKAKICSEDGQDLTVVWWEAGRAPELGARVRVDGIVREYNGAKEVHAVNWHVDRIQPPDHPDAQLMNFYIGCVEAEAAGSVRVDPGSSSHVELISGRSPVHGPLALPSETPVATWCRQRQMALGEQILAGWPMIIGIDQDAGSSRMVASALLLSEARLSEVGGRWTVEPEGGAVDLNPYALDLLEFDRNERDALVRIVDEAPSVEEAKVTEDRVAAILATLAEGGVEELGSLDSSHLAPHDGQAGVHNTGMLIVASGSTQITRMLLEDLEEMMLNPDLLRSGPSAVMLGRSAAPVAALPKPHPTLVPTTLVQDQAVTSAMENVLTVVTGPPGTGKSQVLVNAIAAAASRGETVLFASKNNQAVDVVFERLACVSPDSCVVRAGASSRRSGVASSITKMLATTRQQIDPAGVRARWIEVEGKVQSIHDILHQRRRMEAELEQKRLDVKKLLDSIPERVNTDIDGNRLGALQNQVIACLDAFGMRLGLFRRWNKHQQRLELARRELSALRDFIGLDLKTVETPLRSVADRPRRSFMPRRDFASIHEITNAIVLVQRTQSEIEGIEIELENLPTKQDLDDRLFAVDVERTKAGQALLDARWEQIRWDEMEARTAAGKLAETLERFVTTGSGARQSRRLVASALKALPVWGVTNLSARTNLPLKAGLFDLVIIDEASQCDVASALPLLARARRAMIIGDRRQLTHITTLSKAREKVIAQRSGLTSERASEFSYRSRSCFGLASSRVDESPISLDLHFRSHPAIIGFSNQHFYEGRLELCSSSQPPGRMPALEWKKVDGDSQKGPRGKSWVNRREAKELSAALAEDMRELIGLNMSIGVVSPYRAQVELIQEQLSNLMNAEELRFVDVATAHRFQGDERDIIYFSPVIGFSMPEHQLRFVANPNLVNVALTRARRRLVILGNMDACLQGRNVLSELARYVKRLQDGAFDSPLEQRLSEALLQHGVAAETGVVVAGHRLDLAIQNDSLQLDIECDGAPFHLNREFDAARDRDIEAEGWKVLRFSGRRLSFDLNGCVDDVIEMLKQSPSA